MGGAEAERQSLIYEHLAITPDTEQVVVCRVNWDYMIGTFQVYLDWRGALAQTTD